MMHLHQIWAQLGTARGFVAFAFFVAGNLFAMTWFKRDITQLTMPLGILLPLVYGAGFFKFVVESRNGKARK